MQFTMITAVAFAAKIFALPLEDNTYLDNSTELKNGTNLTQLPSGDLSLPVGCSDADIASEYIPRVLL